MFNTERQNSARSKTHVNVSELLCRADGAEALGKRRGQKRLTETWTPLIRQRLVPPAPAM